MSDKTALRPFQAEFPEADLTDMRRRIKATRLPASGRLILGADKPIPRTIPFDLESWLNKHTPEG